VEVGNHRQLSETDVGAVDVRDYIEDKKNGKILAEIRRIVRSGIRVSLTIIGAPFVSAR
jgi:exoribonuclease II